MVHSSDDYLSLLKSLLPQGDLWTSEEEKTLVKILQGIADEMAKVANRMANLEDETYPNTALELFGDWERVTGFPDDCLGTTTLLLQERRENVLARLTTKNNLTKQFYLDLAQTLGFQIEIEELSPFTVADRVDKPIYDQQWEFVFIVSGPEFTAKYLTCDSTVDGPLASYGNELVQCMILARKPAHTFAIFDFTEV